MKERETARQRTVGRSSVKEVLVDMVADWMFSARRKSGLASGCVYWGVLMFL